MKDIDLIKKRLYSVIPTASLQMFEFLKILNIRFVDSETSSAAITCDEKPELLLNKTFIDKYCKTDEHLFMLVMHELYHIILGHTRMFRIHDDIDNIAFDAIINAMLCRSFSQEEYVSFLESINSDKTFPGAILRPIGDNTPAEYVPLLKTLYFTNTGTYYEVYQAIIKNISKNLSGKSYLLIGNHRKVMNIKNPLLRKAVEKIISKWPRKLILKGRDLGNELTIKQIQLAKANKLAQKKMMKLLKQAGMLNGDLESNKYAIQEIKVQGSSFIPNYYDRTLVARSIIYKNPILFNQDFSSFQNRKNCLVKTIVYLDVSGSVYKEINHFMPLLLKPYKNKECELYVFSTKVEATTYKRFREGIFDTTDGTDINCVFNHFFSNFKKINTRKILILTDGETGEVSSKYISLIKQMNIQVYCGLFGESSKNDLSKVVKNFEEFKNYEINC